MNKNKELDIEELNKTSGGQGEEGFFNVDTPSTCPFCDKNVMKKDMAEHLKNCEKKPNNLKIEDFI